MKKIVVSGLVVGTVNLILGMLLSQVYNFIFPLLSVEYTNSGLFRPWSDPLMSLFFLYPFILGFVLAWVWQVVKKLISGKTLFEKACKFALVYWVIAGLPGMFITYSTFQVSFTMVLTWSLSGLLEAIVAGWILAKMLK